MPLGRANHRSGSVAGWRARTPKYLRDAIRAGWRNACSPLQAAYLTRWVEVRVMGEEWTNADRVIAQARARENAELDRIEGVRGPIAGVCTFPGCGKALKHLGRHRGQKSGQGKHAKPKPEVVVVPEAQPPPPVVLGTKISIALLVEMFGTGSIEARGGLLLIHRRAA